MENFHNLAAQKYWSFPSSYTGDRFSETRNMIFSRDYIGARKMDGAFYKFWKDENGNMELLGRSKSVSGDYLNKIEWVPHLNSFFESLPNGTCLIGEIVFPDNEGSNKITSIMGCLKEKAIARQEKKKVHYYVFDVLAYAGESLYKKDIETRISYLEKLPRDNEFVDFAKYFDGSELWEQLQEILSIGGEGVVITKKGTPYHPGKRPARQTLKVKKELQDTLDVVILGANPPTREYTGKCIEEWTLWEDPVTKEKLEGKFYKDYSDGRTIEPVSKNYFYERAGSLIIGMAKNGKLVPIGSLSGMTEEVLANWKEYRGKVAEVTCMEILETGGLRHPKFVKWRPDKIPADCRIEQI